MKSNKRVQFKQRLSNTGIGNFRFWTGIALGFFSALLFFGFIFYILELVDLFRVIQNFDITIKNKKQLQFEKLFLLALSIAFGNNTMLRFWFSRPTKYFNKTYKYTSSRIVNYSLFIEYVVLFGAISFITRFLLYAPFIDLNIFNEYGYILYLFPVYLFYISWTEISRYVKTQRWMLCAFGVSSIFIVLCSFINVSNYKIGKIAFRKMHHEEIIYIENEIKKAKHDYNIVFSKETINALKELRSERAFALLNKSRLAFKTEDKVSLDTIILEKILIHNFKGYYIDKQQSYKYIFPFQAYEQLRKVEPFSQEATELLNIISEFHKLSVHMTEIEDGGNNSSLYHNKMDMLTYDFHSHNLNLNYNRMYDQTTFLVYHLQKLGKYNHPLVKNEIQYPPPPPMFNRWIENNFPEFTENNN